MKKFIPAALFTLIAASSVLGQKAISPATEGITVTGRGEIPVEADSVVIRGKVKGIGKEPTTALKNFFRTRAKFKKAVNSLEIQGMTLSMNGVVISTRQPMNQQVMFVGGGPTGGPAPKITVSESCALRFSVKGQPAQEKLNLVAGAVEALAEAGLEVASQSQNQDMIMVLAMTGQSMPENGDPDAISWQVSDRESLERALFKRAFDDARSQVAMQTSVAGLTPGPVSHIDTHSGGRIDGIPSPSGVAKMVIRVTFKL